ncbi:hypothetical protein QFC22_005416 [Naganishia vaughanmartiniae]|uniref:Uncharacterized protein n=1 Tax=Naganishia vaughanmartiniae TaxID=1424756 RepID=A0ACC2WTJ3_9TREE|nr:hypothetical protein QFC22_005416 [Naganishia vaughanmartiniae]
MDHPKSNTQTPRVNGIQDNTYVPPSLARFYLTHLTATLIHYQGFTSCHAGVIAELERKLEAHIADIYETAHLLAEECGRRDPQSGDVISALEVIRGESLPRSYPFGESQAEGVGSSTASGSKNQASDEKVTPAADVHRPRRERKALKRNNALLSEELIRFMQRDNRRRSQLTDSDVPVGIPSLPLVTKYTSASTLQPKTISISDNEDNSSPSNPSGSSLAARALKVGKKKRKLGYMLDIRASLPDLPPRHTWKRASSEPLPATETLFTTEQQGASRLSSSALAYLSSTLSTSSNIPPELSLVNHRASDIADPAISHLLHGDEHGYSSSAGPLVQIDYQSSAIQGKLDFPRTSNGYASDSRLSRTPGSTRVKRNGTNNDFGAGAHKRKYKFIVPGLQKRPVNSKVTAI